MANISQNYITMCQILQKYITVKWKAQEWTLIIHKDIKSFVVKIWIQK